MGGELLDDIPALCSALLIAALVSAGARAVAPVLPAGLATRTIATAAGTAIFVRVGGYAASHPDEVDKRTLIAGHWFMEESTRTAVDTIDKFLVVTC